MSERVLLTDDEATVVIECPDSASAESLAAAATMSDGDVSAWLLPREAHPVDDGIKALLRENMGVEAVLDYLAERGWRVGPL